MAALAYTAENSTSGGDRRDALFTEARQLSEAHGTFALRRAQYFNETGYSMKLGSPAKPGISGYRAPDRNCHAHSDTE